MSSIVFCNNDITDIKYSGFTITKVYACGGELVYEKEEEPPYDYSQDYLTFVALEDTVFEYGKDSVTTELSYSLDSGNTWSSPSYHPITPTIHSGETVMWKLGGRLFLNQSNTFSSTGRFSVEGNIMSLLYGDNFSGETSLRGDDFSTLFSGCTGLTTAENLVLPATALTNNCYDRMFAGCTNLTIAPELPATVLTDNCYYYMFANCSNLIYVKCLATDISAYNCTYRWLYNVPTCGKCGTFVKAAGMGYWTGGVSGIPTGWVVKNE